MSVVAREVKVAFLGVSRVQKVLEEAKPQRFIISKDPNAISTILALEFHEKAQLAATEEVQYAETRQLTRPYRVSIGQLIGLLDSDGQAVSFPLNQTGKELSQQYVDDINRRINK